MATMNFFAPTHLLLLPDIIDGPGEYKTRCDEIVTIEAFHQGPKFRLRAHGYYHHPAKLKESWYSSGRVLSHSKSDNDIVSKVTDAE